MKKNLVTIILCAMLVAGCMLCETNEMLSLAFIGIAGGVVALSDLNKSNKPIVKQYTVDELLDIEEKGEWS